LIFYGHPENGIDFTQDVFLCEGEIDCLTLWQSGYKNVLSVPNGANLSKNNVSYFDAISEKFINCPKVVLCFDNDNAGRKLRYEFAERLGKEKCKYVDFKDCKDANDCLQKYDLQSIIESVSQAKDFPLEGVYTISDISDEIDDMYVNGLEQGLIIGFDTFDQHLSFVKGYITTITGIPGHGKSDFLDEIILRLFLHHGWKTAFYSPENKPTKLHFSKFARKVFGKPWAGINRINLTELNYLKNILNNNIWFIKPENDFTLDSILESVKQLKLKHGVDSFEWQIRKIFDTAEQAILWETKVLRRAKVLKRQDIWYNANVAGYKITSIINASIVIAKPIHPISSIVFLRECKLSINRS
jgi:twinkle protein